MLKAIILAAGKGTRMKSEKPKVVHEVLGKPMVYYSIEAARAAGCDKVCVIVGYKAEEVEKSIKDTYAKLDKTEEMQDVVSYALQTEQLGTGHAVKCASDFIGTVPRSGSIPRIATFATSVNPRCDADAPDGDFACWEVSQTLFCGGLHPLKIFKNIWQKCGRTRSRPCSQKMQLMTLPQRKEVFHYGKFTGHRKGLSRRA